MKKIKQMQEESMMNDINIISKVMAVLEKGLQDSQKNTGDNSAEYRLGKMDAYMEVLSVISSYSSNE